MPISLDQIRDILLPGLYGISGKYPLFETQWAHLGWEEIKPALTTKEVLLLGTAAIIAKNPEITRRFWRAG